MSKLAPIVLFVYNRPWHARQTLEALMKNKLADQSELFVFADGAKGNTSVNDTSKIEEVRSIAKEKKWCGSVTIVESEYNKGLADSIVDGVTQIINKYGKVIVLEDDIVTSPGFLQYMNDALDVYKDEEKVMHVSGYMFPVKGQLPETFFYNTGSCWGWGTWKRSWGYLNTDAKKLADEIISKSLRKKFNVNETYNFFQQLELNISGARKTWAIKWYASFFLKRGLALHPGKSLVNNIGHDDSGDNCGKTNVFSWTKLASKVGVNQIELRESKFVLRQMEKFNKQLNKEETSMDKIKHLSKIVLSKIKVLPLISPGKDHEIKQIERSKREGAKQLQNWKSLDKVPRFQKGRYTDSNFQYDFVDAASFKFTYSELFKDQIYKFTTLNDTPLIIDCGANIGISVLYFKKLFPNSEIIAFEPDEKIFKVLNTNISQNNLTNVMLYNNALWSEETILKFHQEGADGGRIEALNVGSDNIVELKTKKLSSYLTKEVDLLKIDIEGAEYEVLNECKDQLHFVNNLFVEYHSFANKKQNLSQLLQIISDAGFRYYVSSIGIHSAHPLVNLNTTLGMDNQLNIFAFK